MKTMAFTLNVAISSSVRTKVIACNHSTNPDRYMYTQKAHYQDVSSTKCQQHFGFYLHRQDGRTNERGYFMQTRTCLQIQTGTHTQAHYQEVSGLWVWCASNSRGSQADLDTEAWNVTVCIHKCVREQHKEQLHRK